MRVPSRLSNKAGWKGGGEKSDGDTNTEGFGRLGVGCFSSKISLTNSRNSN